MLQQRVGGQTVEAQRGARSIGWIDNYLKLRVAVCLAANIVGGPTIESTGCGCGTACQADAIIRVIR